MLPGMAAVVKDLFYAWLDRLEDGLCFEVSMAGKMAAMRDRRVRLAQGWSYFLVK